MTPIFKTLVATALCGVSITALTATSAMAQNDNSSVLLPGIDIYSTIPLLPSENKEDPDSPKRPPVTGDPGEFLRHINGIDAGRMGGHGLEAVIRGLDQNQINITNDGAFHFGGCPNRMDPPTSHMQLYTYDKVTVKKGYQSVLDGPPAPGGTLEFARDILQFGPEMSVRGKTGAGFNSNGSRLESFFDVAIGNDWGYIRGFGSVGKASNYKDGSGNKIPSSFKQFGGGLIITRTFDADSWVNFKVENNNVDDVLFPGAGMDAPRTDDWTFQGKFASDVDWGMVKGIKGDVYLTTVDHVMNNFDLRDRPAPAPYFEARVDSDTLGGKFAVNGETGNFTFDAGVSYRDVMRDGTKYGGPNGDSHPSGISAILWGDTSIKELGLFGEVNVPLSDATKLTAGLRYSHVNASMKKDDKASNFAPAVGRTPNQVFTAIYGSNARKDKSENNVSGLVRLQHDLGDGLNVFATASRSVRTADASERFMVNLMGMGGAMSWVGNPDIKPEKHHQVEIGTRYKNDGFNFTGSAFYNSVQDFIQLYAGQNVGAPYTNVSIYRNISAHLAGVEAEASFKFAEHWQASASAAYTYGRNKTSHTALAQVAPLSGKLEVSYDNTIWMAGARLNMAAKQNRTDAASSGIDAGATKGYVTMDLFGAYNVTEKFQISAGVTNLLDKTYAHHLNKANLTNPGVRVNEPGRSFYVRATATF